MVRRLAPRSSMKSMEILFLTLLRYLSTLPQFHMYITSNNKKAKARGSQPPPKIFDSTADKYRSSTAPKIMGNDKARNRLVYQIRNITSVTKPVLTNITPTSAMPGMTNESFSCQKYFLITVNYDCINDKSRKKVTWT